MPKKILLSFDGTDNSPIADVSSIENNKTFSNPLKLHILAGGSVDGSQNAIEGQVCLYERGIAQRTRLKPLQPLLKALGRIEPQVNSMIKRLAAVYEEGDEVSVIGFSRGGSAARVLAVRLSRGLPEFDNKVVPIKFLGCFDCVAMQIWKNLIPILIRRINGNYTSGRVLGEKDGKLPDNVSRAVHYVSIDDARFKGQFPPCLMDSNDKRVHEAWYVGQHGDVGGSKYDDGISSGAGMCMQEWLEREAGLRFLTPAEIREDFLKIPDAPELTIDPDKLALVFNPAGKIHTQPNRTSDRPLGAITNAKTIEGATVKVHVNTLTHANARKELGKFYAINPEAVKAKDRIVIVDNRGEKLERETEEFKQFLETVPERPDQSCCCCCC